MRSTIINAVVFFTVAGGTALVATISWYSGYVKGYRAGLAYGTKGLEE